MSQSKNKPKSVFEREMQKSAFRQAYEAERRSFALEVQILNLLESNQMNLADLARTLGMPRGNVSRDLSQQAIRHARLSRVQTIADAIDADFVPLIMPRDPSKRRTVLNRFEKAFAASAGTR
jgi:predicted XRE-type DNA-binding protein